MFDWISKLFIDEKINNNKFSEKERQEREKNLAYLKEKNSKRSFNLECKGSYSYKLEKCVISNKELYFIYINYNMDTSVEGELDVIKMVGRILLTSKSNSEKEAYETILNSMREEGVSLMSRLKEDIITKFKRHIDENETEKLKELLKKSKPISVEFTIKNVK